jgi:hypothetical protein
MPDKPRKYPLSGEFASFEHKIVEKNVRIGDLAQKPNRVEGKQRSLSREVLLRLIAWLERK